MKKEITYQEAKELIELYPTEDDYIVCKIKRFLNRDNDPDDNSIDLSNHYQSCRKIFDGFHVT